MQRWILLMLALVGLAWLLGCNKQRPHMLDYSQKIKEGLYSPPHGLPGESQVGTPPYSADSKGRGSGPVKRPK